ncbi:hypothetical protein M3650_07630 [Paenibacillus sp. MER TA 81-3]|uniref:tetrahydrofolate dehydrogenase/cyclohydrolase catalytic domain-containing protein n=1 Tax=Paenibacillus sp. MER TA 81-3 TaxID=2939573 RepID=UPI00203CB81A|nr:tetrahydrofolate dehydrogenase/cyclohydrolase catalytic domain-containing protein [Paenibacillus sp. MER TA 81-3]MCM3338504.1 hypothetical protein [Paenibacillus sp. MER TA 81-3]
MGMVMKAKEAADAVYNDIRKRVEEYASQGHLPCIATILVEGDLASAYYAKMKQKAAKQ